MAAKSKQGKVAKEDSTYTCQEQKKNLSNELEIGFHRLSLKRM